MSIYDAARILKPSWWRIGPVTRGRGERKTYVIGFDSEADQRGRPFLYQFAHPSGRVDLIDVDASKKTGSLFAFLDYLKRTCTDKTLQYVVYGFNLQYEYTQIFRDVPEEITDEPEFVLTWPGDETAMRYTLRAMNDKRFSFTVEFGKTKRVIKVIDAFAFIHTSLADAAKIIGATPKLAKPKRFGPDGRHDADFIAYAEADARATQEIGEYITRLHEQYDVATCISAPHFAARTFRRRYLTRDLDPLDVDVEQIGLDSYHGGKNGFYLNRPTIFGHVFNYDIRSAYPEAMAQLPNPEQSTFEFVPAYEPGLHAIWRASVIYSGCPYHPLYHEDNSRVAPRNEPQSVTITGYELDAALDCGAVELLTCEGFAMIGEPGGPLAEYVADFFAMKRDAKTSAERNTAKLFLNSLYGKFFQKQPLGDVGMYDLETGQYLFSDPDAEYDYQAGGLYHPPIASLITGYVRGKIHRLEHKYRSLMTSTDGFFATLPPDDGDLGDGIGMLDVTSGELRIWRERLYVFTPKGDGKRKVALHGFHGTVEALLQMPMKLGNFLYVGRAKPLTLKEATRSYRGLRYGPGEFVTLDYHLALTGGGGGGIRAGP